MGVRALRLNNLPLKITEEELKQGLLQFFPDEFGPIINDLTVKIFKPGTNARGQPTQIATIWLNKGEVNLVSLQRTASNPAVRIKGREWRFLEDYYEDRYEDGSLIHKLTPDQVRERNSRRGVGSRRPMEIFNKAFLSKLGNGIWRGWNTIYVKNYSQFNKLEEDWKHVGKIAGMNVEVVFDPIKKETNKVLSVAFSSSLESLQAITFYNLNGAEFCDQYGGHMCLTKFQSGLGTSGDPLDVQDVFVNKGYIPFDDIRKGIIDESWINAVVGKCWRCQIQWKVLGVEPNLNYFAGTCECKYDKKLDPMSDARGYFWSGENFTRLQLQKSMEGDSFEWRILHEPLAMIYVNKMHYREIVGPVLQEEWKFDSEQFRLSSYSEGVLSSCQLIEKVGFHGGKKNVYTLDITVPKSRFWNEECLFKIGGLTLELKLAKSSNRLEKRKAQLCDVLEQDNSLVIRCRSLLVTSDTPLSGSKVNVVAKPIKTEYSAIHHTINKWIKTESQPGLLAILNPSHPIAKCEEKFLQRQKRQKINQGNFMKLRGALNPKQQEAFDTAMSFPLSVIHGPPGTGKTTTAAILICALEIKELGTILCGAPSNFAADNLAVSIGKHFKRYMCPPYILRIYSLKKASYYEKTKETIDLGPHVKILHDEVIGDPEWLSTPEIKKTKIRQRLDNKRFDLLTTNERDILESHRRKIEQRIMDKAHIIVATCATYCDNRISDWDNEKKKITTVLVDEAGMLPQPNALTSFFFGQIRTIFVGDNEQLKHQLNSHSAKIAGLASSVMEGFATPGSKIPWTTLEIQHRMQAANREIVSQLTYHGVLKDAESVAQRPPYAEKFFSQFQPKLKSRVLVLDHHYFEAKSATSYYNSMEAKGCVKICHNLLQMDVNAEEIVVLSPYESQRAGLESQLKPLAVNVKNIDAFQGRESNVIVLSMVRGGQGGDIGFLAEKNRLNVAISRARELLIILCNTATYRRHQSNTVSNFMNLLDKFADIRPMAEVFDLI